MLTDLHRILLEEELEEGGIEGKFILIITA
jgi:hypothetical protein